MKASIITGPGKVETVESPTPTAGSKDILVKIRACGLCGSDNLYISIGGLPPHEGTMPLGHEAAGEIVEVGSDVSGLAVGDHVVINPMARPEDIIGNGGTTGALADYLLIRNAVRGASVEVLPASVPFEVAALNEPMAVARHAVNQVAPKPTDKAMVFGAGPIGLGATIALKSLGVSHVVVADIVPARLDKALKVGADAVINSADEDVVATIDRPSWQLGNRYGRVKPAPTSTWTLLAFLRSSPPHSQAAKRGAKLGVVAVHKEPVTVDLMNVMSNEITIVGSMGYPTEIFEVTRDIVENWQKYAVIISHTFSFEDVQDALRCAATPGAADKVVVTFD